MGVILSHHLSDQTGAFLMGAGMNEIEFSHRIEYPAVHGLQPVTNIRQSPGYDNRHRIIDVRITHFFFKGPYYNVFAAACIHKFLYSFNAYHFQQNVSVKIIKIS